MEKLIKIFNELSEIEYGSLNIQTLKPHGKISGKDFIGTVFGKVPILKNNNVEYFNP